MTPSSYLPNSCQYLQVTEPNQNPAGQANWNVRRFMAPCNTEQKKQAQNLPYLALLHFYLTIFSEARGFDFELT